MNNYNPLLHHRHSIRLQGYDYSQEGLYFVTVRTHNMQCLFGNITNGQMILNQFGQIIESACQQIEQQSPYIRFNIYCIMPNHFHAIIEITSPCTGGSRTALSRPTKPLGRIIGAFKTITTKNINLINNTPGQRLWHRNYYEHIIRNDYSYQNIYNYILENPERWDRDKYRR